MNDDYILQYEADLSLEPIFLARNQKEAILQSDKYYKYIPEMKLLADTKTQHISVDKGIVEIGQEHELNTQQHQELVSTLKQFMPWKKGPFSIYGHMIDAEWRSDFKWHRIEPVIKSLTGKRVADIGCNNGYFMYRMAAQNPQIVVGFEPYVKHYYTFKYLQHFKPLSNLAFERLGVESIHLFENFFDTIFCLGILYHHPDPLGILKKIWASMKSGSELIIDCQGITGEESYALCPSSRYARARGIWFLPTLPCLMNWLKRSQFRNIKCFFNQPLDVSEQRSSSWAPIDSLADFLDPNDPTKTIEGYPAPYRFYVKAQK